MAIWETLLAPPEEVSLPWLGGRTLQDGQRTWRIVGGLPPEHGWHTFQVDGSRRATWRGAASPDFAALEGRPVVRGWMVGNWLIPEDARGESEPGRFLRQGLRLRLVEAGLERFARVRATRWSEGCWLFAGPDFPLGPEDAVAAAFQDRAPGLEGIAGVPPALELAFRWLTWQRDEAAAARRRAEEAREAAEAARARALEEARRLQVEEAALERWLVEQEALEAEAALRRAARAEAEAQRLEVARGAMADGALRRRLARRDFQAAAEAALAVSGAELLDSREGAARGERVVTFRLEGSRYECVVDAETLRVIDAGICLIDHGTGERGDTYFTLESLPAVILHAEAEGRLVVFRHAEAPRAAAAPAGRRERRRRR